MYRSKIGDVMSYEDWEKWADSYYSSLPKMSVGVGRNKKLIEIKKPADWFKRVSKVLKLEEIEGD